MLVEFNNTEFQVCVTGLETVATSYGKTLSCKVVLYGTCSNQFHNLSGHRHVFHII